MCMFCISLFVLLYIFIWPLCCLFFFDVRILITPLVSSNSSCICNFFYSRNLTSGVPSLLCVCTLGGRRDDKFQLHIQCFSIHTSLLVTQWTVSMHFYTTSNDTRTTMIPRCSVIDGSKEYCSTAD